MIYHLISAMTLPCILLMFKLVVVVYLPALKLVEIRVLEEFFKDSSINFRVGNRQLPS